MSEIFPVKARGVASAVCVLTNWSMAFIVTKTFQDMMVSAHQDTVSRVWLYKDDESMFSRPHTTVSHNINIQFNYYYSMIEA